MSTMREPQPNRYTQPSGDTGVGFVIDYAGIEQHSVAWEAGPAARYKTDELEELGIKCEACQLVGESDVAQLTAIDPSEVGQAGEVENIKPPIPAVDPETSNDDNIRRFILANDITEGVEVIKGLHEAGIEVSLEEVKRVAQELAAAKL